MIPNENHLLVSGDETIKTTPKDLQESIKLSDDSRHAAPTIALHEPVHSNKIEDSTISIRATTTHCNSKLKQYKYDRKDNKTECAALSAL